jgi:predicted DNA-binding WGR domain protein
VDDGKVVWNVMLNQTNISNNNNKFYVIQMLQDDVNTSKYYCFTRWARVGLVGQFKLDEFNSIDGAKKAFESKFRDKTKNQLGRHLRWARSSRLRLRQVHAHRDRSRCRRRRRCSSARQEGAQGRQRRQRRRRRRRRCCHWWWWWFEARQLVQAACVGAEAGRDHLSTSR